MNGGLGDVQWAMQTAGVLGERDQLELRAQLLVLQDRLASPPEAHDLSFDEIVVPDSALCRDAEALCRDVSQPWLHAHCARTYYWSAAFGLRDALAFDAEILWVASLLHDLGITPTYEGSVRFDCFAAIGAEAAETFALARGCTAPRARAIADAIALHLNVWIPIEDGVEAHLLGAGVTLEVAGLRLPELPRDLVERVAARYPRDDAAGRIAEVIRDQGSKHPETRSGFLLNEIRLADLAVVSPLDRTS